MGTTSISGEPKNNMAAILIVEDDERISGFMRFVLTAVGHDVTDAKSATKASELLASGGKFDLITLDHHLAGGQSGLAFLLSLRNSEEHSRMPVVICSGDTMKASVTTFLSLGISGFVVKPFRPEKLVAEVQRALDLAAAKAGGHPAPES